MRCWHCPECGSWETERESQWVEDVIDGKVGYVEDKDNCRATCLSCGWEGKGKDLDFISA